MRICLVIDDHMARSGGVQEYVKGLYRYLINKGHEVWILAGKSPISMRANLPDMRIKEIGVSPSFVWNGSQTSPIPLVINQKPVKKFFEKHQFDVVHVQAPYSLLGRAALMQSKSKNFITFLISANDTLRMKIASIFMKLFYASTWKRIDGYITFSKEAKRFASKYYPKPRSGYVWIPGAIDTNFFNPRRPKVKEFVDNYKNIIFIGRLDVRKGIMELLKAYKIVKKTCKVPVRLLIVGLGPQKEQADEFIKVNNLKNVVFLSKKSVAKANDLRGNYLATSHIACYPALYGESFGIVLIEAMASGLPVVAYDNKGYHTVLSKCTPEYLVTPGNYKMLARKIIRLLTDQKLRKKIAEINYKEGKKYSWEKVGQQILNLYEQKLNE